MIRRRAFIGIASAAVVGYAFGAPGQQPGGVRRVGLLINTNPRLTARGLAAFRQRLQELGWVEGRNIVLETRWADGNLDELPALASELVDHRVEIIVVAGTAALRAVRQRTTRVPVVAAMMSDPIGNGFAVSLARPGANITGVAVQLEDLDAKQLELLREIAPRISRVAILHHTVLSPQIRNATAQAANALGLDPRVIELRKADGRDIDRAFDAARAESADAMVVLASPALYAQRRRLAELAIRYRMPTIYELRDFVEDGGLMSYGPDLAAMYGAAAGYVDRILKGDRPAELPIEQPTKFELAINLKTAQSLGLTIPASLKFMAEIVR